MMKQQSKHSKIPVNEHAKKSDNSNEDWQNILNYWNEIPVFSVNDFSKKNVIEQEIRNNIIEILRLGVVETGFGQNKCQRHALNAKEIQEFVESKLGSPIKLTNIYFHLQKLVEHDFLKIIAAPMEGKHHVSYYGITSKLFIFRDPNKGKGKHKNTFKQLINLISLLNPEIKREEIEKIIDSASMNSDTRIERITSWIKQHEAIITSLEIDFQDIFNILQELSVYDSKEAELAEKLSKLLLFRK